MDQLPDIVIVLLLIGVDVGTTTQLRRDILHSVSLLCRRLPGDDIVRVIRGSGVHATLLTVSRRSLWPKRCWNLRGPSHPPTRLCYCHFSPKAALAAFVSLVQSLIMSSLASLFHPYVLLSLHLTFY
jgi:hypothetical protein